MTSSQNIHQEGDHAKRQVQPWVEALARTGYTARGLVYIIIGSLAFQAAFGLGGRTISSRGALHTIAGQPFGRILLIFVGIGLLGYALWRLVEAAFDPEGRGTNAQGIVQRAGSAFSGLAYVGLSLTSFKIISGISADRVSPQRDWTAWLLSQPLGQWIVALVGVIVIGVGMNALYKAVTGKFRDKLKVGEMSAGEKTCITSAGRAGYSARGIVWVMIGWFLIQAGRSSDASETRSLPQILDALAAQPYGPWLMGIVAVGLIAYGLYALAEARYRRIHL